MRVEGETLDQLRRKSPKVAGYIRFLEMLKKLKTSDRVQAILNSDDFPSATPEVSEALATLDCSQT